MKSMLQNISVVAAACLICLVGIELGLRAFGPDVLALGNASVFYRFDPVLGWANLPGSSGRFARIEFSYQVNINTEGMFDAEVEAKKDDEFRIALMGDSFTWGLGVPYGERFSEVMERQSPTTNVLNFGVSGYSPVQHLLGLDQALSMDPDHVLVALTLGNDLEDNIRSRSSGYSQPYARLTGDGGAVEIVGYPLTESHLIGPNLIGTSSSLRILGLVRLVQIAMAESATGDRTDQHADASGLRLKPDTRTMAQMGGAAEIAMINEHILARIKARISSAIGPDRFTLILVPSKYEYSIDRTQSANHDPDAVADVVLDSASRLGIAVIDGRDVIGPEDYWEEDWHWRPSGHQKIGTLVAEVMERNRLN